MATPMPPVAPVMRATRPFWPPSGLTTIGAAFGAEAAAAGLAAGAAGLAAGVAGLAAGWAGRWAAGLEAEEAALLEKLRQEE